MKFPNWFRIAWWLAVLASLGLCIYARFETISSGTPTNFDIALVVLTAAVALMPIYSEISIGSLTLKQQIESVKTEIREAVNTISQRVEQHTSVNHQVHFYQNPPLDKDLPSLQKLTEAAVELSVDEKSNGIGHPIDFDGEPPEVEPTVETMFLSTTRVKLEKALRELAIRSGLRLSGITNFYRIMEALRAADVLPVELVTPLKAIYSICSAAVHANEVSQFQIDFVRQNQKEVIRAIRNLG